MRGLPFLQFIRLCELNAEKKYVDGCLNLIKNEDCLYNGGFFMPYHSTLSLYQLRLSIAKNSTGADSNYISDFEGMVANMGRAGSESIGFANLVGYEFSYLIFYGPKDRLILGILRGEGYKKHLAGLNGRAAEIAKRENYTNMETYSKGVQTHYV